MERDQREHLCLPEVMRFSAEHLQLAVEASGIGLWCWNIENGELLWNQQCRALFAVSSDTPLDYGVFLQRVHPADRARIEAETQAAIREHSIHDQEFRIQRPDGAVRWIASRGAAEYDANGEPLRMMGSVVDITARKRVEEHLRENEQRWRGLLDSNIIGVVIGDEARVFEANQVFLDMLGYTGEELERGGLPWRSMTPAQHRAKDDEALTQILERGFCTPFQKELLHREGWRVPILVGSTRLQRTPLRYLSFALDLTELKRAESRLRGGDRALRAMADAAPAYLYKMRADLTIEYVTPYLFEFTGLAPASISILASNQAKIQLEDLLHPQDVEGMRQAWLEARDSKAPLRVEFRLRRSDGSYRWFAARADSELDEAGEVACFYGAAFEIHSQRETQAALRESESQLRALTTAAPAYMFKVLPDLTVSLLTPYFYEFTGLAEPPDGAIGTVGVMVRNNTFLHPDELEKIDATWRNAARIKKPLNAEFRMRRADGAYRWFAIRVQPEFDEHGRQLCFYGAAIEIHAQKEAELALREADRRKDEFLAMLAHELRNPLTPIANTVELLKMLRPDDHEVAAVGEMVGRQSMILKRIIDDLLDVSRVTQGKIRLERNVVELGAIARDVVEAAKTRLASRLQSLEVVARDGAVEVMGDPMRLTQVMTNLLNNAITYSPERTTIRLTIAREGDQAVFRLRDNGYGIEAQFIPYIFDLFTQSERTPGRSQGGLGIGLTIVRKIVELHGGRVEAFSEGAGQGSEFVVCLPARSEEQRADGRAEQARLAETDRARILVVDDNADCADTMGLLLKMSGFDVEIARDGASALDLFLRFYPAVVLLDIGLPDLDGYTVARRIRETPNGRAVKIVAVTGYGQARDRANSKAAGFDAHLVKPVELAKLLEAISRSPQSRGADHALSV